MFLWNIAALMDDLLSHVTGLGEFSRKVVVYYILATHALESLDTFPLLVLKGPQGTGKSSTLHVIASFARKPNRFSLRARTLPTIRDELVLALDGTAIIEEADQAWKDAEAFERMLSDRYQRETAQAAYKEPDGDGGHHTIDMFLFGATVLHRRLSFCDTALNGRSVLVRFRADHNKTYRSIEEVADDLACGPEIVRDLNMSLPNVAPLHGIGARIFDTYRPILAVAQLLGDVDFLTQMKEHLALATIQLKEDQSFEPDGIVLRALIERLTAAKGRFDFSRNIKIGSIADAVWNNERVQLKPQQVAALLRDLGFKTKNSHGVTVVVPKPGILVKACSECGYEDELVASLRKELLSGREGRAGRPISVSGMNSESRASDGQGTGSTPVRTQGTQSKPTPHAEGSLPSLPGLPNRKSGPIKKGRREERRETRRRRGQDRRC